MEVVLQDGPKIVQWVAWIAIILTSVSVIWEKFQGQRVWKAMSREFFPNMARRDIPSLPNIPSMKDQTTSAAVDSKKTLDIVNEIREAQKEVAGKVTTLHDNFGQLKQDMEDLKASQEEHVKTVRVRSDDLKVWVGHALRHVQNNTFNTSHLNAEVERLEALQKKRDDNENKQNGNSDYVDSVDPD